MFNIIYSSSKSLNPHAQEWRPTPPLHLLPGISFPSSYSCRLSPPIPTDSQQSYYYYCYYHHFPSHEGIPAMDFNFPPDHEYFNEGMNGGKYIPWSEARSFNNGDGVVEIHKDEGIVPSATNVKIVRRNSDAIKKGKRKLMLPPRLQRATRSVPVANKPPAKQDCRPKQSRHSGAGAYCSRRLSAAHFSHSNTTVMIKNIPNQFGREFMLSFLDDCCRAYILQYDFLYLPIDFRKENNLGYGFVNFTTAAAAHQFRNVLQNYEWGTVHTDIGPIVSKKICEIRWAKVQGKEALINKFQNSIFECNSEDFLPVVLDPPRNGWNSDESVPTVIGKLQGLG